MSLLTRWRAILSTCEAFLTVTAHVLIVLLPDPLLREKGLSTILEPHFT